MAIYGHVFSVKLLQILNVLAEPFAPRSYNTGCLIFVFFIFVTCWALLGLHVSTEGFNYKYVAYV